MNTRIQRVSRLSSGSGKTTVIHTFHILNITRSFSIVVHTRILTATTPASDSPPTLTVIAGSPEAGRGVAPNDHRERRHPPRGSVAHDQRDGSASSDAVAGLVGHVLEMHRGGDDGGDRSEALGQSGRRRAREGAPGGRLPWRPEVKHV